MYANVESRKCMQMHPDNREDCERGYSKAALFRRDSQAKKLYAFLWGVHIHQGENVNLLLDVRLTSPPVSIFFANGFNVIITHLR